jgi:hypothetical protein
MNTSLMALEIWVIALGIVLMLAEKIPGLPRHRRPWSDVPGTSGR